MAWRKGDGRTVSVFIGEFRIAGWAHNGMPQDARAAFRRGSSDGVVLRVECEHGNAADPSAVALYDGPQRVGFIPIPANRIVCSLAAVGFKFTATAYQEKEPMFQLECVEGTIP